MNWKLAACVFAANVGCIVLMIGTQYLIRNRPPRGSYIPGTSKKFLYWQDFYCQRIGDLVGVSLIQVSFAHFVVAHNPEPLLWVIFSGIACLDAVGFTVMCLGEGHKPDYGFPAVGKVSLAGALHSAYHGVNIAIAVATIYAFVQGLHEITMLGVAIVGGAVYIGSVIADFRVGNFDPLKKNE